MCLKSCCCCSLKTGSIIIASLGWIFTLIKIFWLVQVAIQHQNGTGGTPMGVNIGYAVLALVTCGLLVYGVVKDNQYFLLPWLILSCLECVVSSIVSIIFLFLLCTLGSQLQAAGILGLFVFLFFLVVGITGLCWYFWAVVLSYYQQLAQEVGGLRSV